MSHPAFSLRELEAEYVIAGRRGSITYTTTFADAQGIIFVCPKCYHENKCSNVGVHMVLVWFKGKGAPDEAEPVARWSVIGSGADDLSLTPSVNVLGCWHGWVRHGFASDAS